MGVYRAASGLYLYHQGKNCVRLFANEMNLYLETHPEERPAIDRREQETIACIEKNKAIISKHYASLAEMRHELIRSGFIDIQK